MKSLKKSLLFCGYLIFVFELGGRVFLWTQQDQAFIHPDKIINKYYPELNRIQKEDITQDDGVFDILLLGGSVLQYCGTEDNLPNTVAGEIADKIRIHNVATLGHSSLDSFYKYSLLEDQNFDLVLFYHGINDVRANNVPPDKFDIDYSHYSWYREINEVWRHTELRFIALPYVSNHAARKIHERLRPPDLVPAHRPNREWTQYGHTINTARSFQRNLNRIIQKSQERNEPFLLMTFANYLPENYSKKAFLKRNTLDYSNERAGAAVEMWGEKQNVQRGIRVHNDIIRTTARNNSHITITDFDRMIPKNGNHFVDICHLTVQGCRKFGLAIVRVAQELMQENAMLKRESLDPG